MAPFTHHGDYAVVSFFDDVTWPTIVDLVDSVDTLLKSYHYTEIELQISSCGGLADVSVDRTGCTSKRARRSPAMQETSAHQTTTGTACPLGNFVLARPS